MGLIPIDVLKNTNRHNLGDSIDIVLFRIVRFANIERYLGERGANIILYESGKEFGKSLNTKSIDEVVKFCKDYKVGLIEIVNKNPIQIRVYECISCSGLPEIGKKLCYFEAGFIAGCLENILGKKVQVRETHCAGLGNDYCQFEVKIL